MDDSRKYIACTRYTQLYVELSLAIANIADRETIRKKITAVADLNFSINGISACRKNFPRRAAPRRAVRAIRLTEH